MKEKLYENIRQRRKALKLTQQELAERTGYTNRSAIARIEAGDIDLSQSKILQFAKALETTPSELMGETENEEPHLDDLALRVSNYVRIAPDNRALIEAVIDLPPDETEYTLDLIRRLTAYAQKK